MRPAETAMRGAFAFFFAARARACLPSGLVSTRERLRGFLEEVDREVRIAVQRIPAGH